MEFFANLQKKPMEKYYHLYSSPMEKTPLFRDSSDKNYFLNRIAICLQIFGFKVYAFVLMDNHIHLLVSGEEESILAAFSEIKRAYAKYLAATEGVVKVDINEFSVSMRLITGEEDFKTVVAYILRNPMKAGLGSPFHYEWSSNYLYFNPLLNKIAVKTLREYGTINVRNKLKTRVTLPDSYVILDDVIFPGCWVSYRKVEQVFGKSSDLFYMLHKWTVEQDEEAKMEAKEKNAYTDEALIAKLKEFCSLNGVGSIVELSITEQRSLISLAHRRWGASRKQLKRILGLSHDLIDRYY